MKEKLVLREVERQLDAQLRHDYLLSLIAAPTNAEFRVRRAAEIMDEQRAALKPWRFRPEESIQAPNMADPQQVTEYYKRLVEWSRKTRKPAEEDNG